MVVGSNPTRLATACGLGVPGRVCHLDAHRRTLPAGAVVRGDGAIESLDRDEATWRHRLRSATAESLDEPDHLDRGEDRDQSARQEPQERESQGLLEHEPSMAARPLPAASGRALNHCSALAMSASGT